MGKGTEGRGAVAGEGLGEFLQTAETETVSLYKITGHEQQRHI